MWQCIHYTFIPLQQFVIEIIGQVPTYERDLLEKIISIWYLFDYIFNFKVFFLTLVGIIT